MEDILIPQYASWKKTEEINFEELPNSFVVKTNHGRSDIKIITDKNKVNRAIFNKYFNKQLDNHDELLHYARIKPLMIAELLLVNDNESLKYSFSLIDYKFWCFNGKPCFCWVCCNHNEKTTEVMTYDMHWNAHPEYSIFDEDYKKR